MTRGQVLCLAVLLALSPLFMVLSDMVGYREPLDLAAEALGLEDLTEDINWTPLLDYSVPGLDPLVGYPLSGLMGVAVILGLGRLLERVWVRGRHREGGGGPAG